MARFGVLVLLIVQMGWGNAQSHDIPYCDDKASAHQVTDVFGRELGGRPLLLPDWEGYMANPAIMLAVQSAHSATSPIVAMADSPLIQFPIPSRTEIQGSTKTLDFTGGPVSRFVAAAFPQRQKRQQHATLTIASVRSACRVSIVVLPVMTRQDAPTYPVTVDFSQDRTGFFDEPRHRQVFQQALDDWAFYLDGSNASTTEAGQERTWVWDKTGFKTGRAVSNAAAYRGFLLYAYGISGEEMRSGGAPSKFMSVRTGSDASRPRSGSVEIDTVGNYHKLGWLDPALADERWWLAESTYKDPADLYSIMRHEIGHALFFHPLHPGFVPGASLPVRQLDGEPRSLKTDRHGHFDGLLDGASLRGPFGGEHEGPMSHGRWLITRMDLLTLAELGHPMRPVAALRRLAIDPLAAPALQAGCGANLQLSASGGIPYYDWEIVDGALPGGLVLDRHSGVITGIPAVAGQFQIAVQVRDHEMSAVRSTLTLVVGEGRNECR